MTISYSLAPIPKWYIADLTGRPLGGGSMYTYSSLNPGVFKHVFQDPAGINAWPDPILFDENGSQGPFYWTVDSAALNDTYAIEVYDAAGNLVWFIDGFAPSGSGGSVVTTAINLQNLIVNNVMWQNTGVTPIATAEFLPLCPGTHAALAQTASNYGPDIHFVKNNLSATDTISFPRFTTGSSELTDDITPVDYLKYSCSVAGSSETFKYVQFPITQGVQNLSNQNIAVTIWARGNSGTTTLRLQWAQFFGDGPSASTTVQTTIADLTLTTGWVKYGPFNVPTPSVATKVLGECGNDGLFLQVQFPLDAICNIDFTKPGAYLGNIAPTEDYESYSTIAAAIFSERTSSLKTGFSPVPQNVLGPDGYIPLDDGTIGSDGSIANTRKGTQVFPLYNLLWLTVSSLTANAWCAVSGGLGASAVDDFVANKTLSLPRALGRLLAGGGQGVGLTNRILGSYLGTETISISDMPSHSHTISPPNITQTGVAANTFGSGGGSETGTITIGSTGGSAADGKMPPVTFMSYYMKL